MELKDSFLNYMRGNNASEATLRNYDNMITFCFDFLGVKTDEDILSVTKKKVIEYLTYIVNERKVEASSRNTYYVPVRQLYRYILGVEKKNIDTEILEIQFAKTEKKKRVYLTPPDAYQMLETITDIRSQSIVRLLLRTGLRVSELINIKLTDMTVLTDQYGYNYYKILIHGKGHKERYVYADYDCYKVIEKYKTKRRAKTLARLGQESEYLFVSNNGYQMDDSNIRKMIKYWGRMINFKEADKLSPHKLRHSYATNMLQAKNEQGGLKNDIKTVSASLGHANIQTTSIYAHTDEDRISEMQREGW